ncbi:glycosyltransferase family 9 protein [Radicibacter daui]|uniref:glycosyltransferase family 9 protein n=1 Tax=Radicibacter daui TaxID=3064829 RepID=UPI004046D12E
MANILIIKLGAFGDVLQAEGALHDIRENHPGDRITVLTRRPFRTILERCPWVEEVLVDDHAPRWRLDRQWALARALRSRRFERVYDLQGSGRTAFYWRWLLPEPDWAGFCSGMRWSHPHPTPKSLNGRERIAALLSAAGLTPHHTLMPDLNWMVDPVGELLAAHGLEAGRYVLLFPGSSAKHPGKRWPGFAELAGMISTHGLTPITMPGPDEMELCQALPATAIIKADRSPFTYFQLAGVARAAAAIVGNDTGPTHLAAYLGRPGLALFGKGTKRPDQIGLDVGDMSMLFNDPLAALKPQTVMSALETKLVG